MTPPPLIATAGWSIPRDVAGRFPSQGSGLQRYAARFEAAEVNSTFYRSHRSATYARWYAATPTNFRFAVKLPRAITHDARLAVTQEPLAAFRDEVAGLREKLGPLLVQLPPSLALELSAADRFFSNLREIWRGAIAFEPRHPTWFEADAEALLRDYEIGRVAADPAPHPAAGAPGGWKGLAYCVSTVALACTIRRMGKRTSPHWPLSCVRQFRPRLGAYSTTPPRARPPPTRWIYAIAFWRPPTVH